MWGSGLTSRERNEERLLFHARILLYRFGGDGGGRLRGVVLLNVSAGSGDGSPYLATTDANGDTKQDQRQQDALA